MDLILKRGRNSTLCQVRSFFCIKGFSLGLELLRDSSTFCVQWCYSAVKVPCSPVWFGPLSKCTKLNEHGIQLSEECPQLGKKSSPCGQSHSPLASQSFPRLPNVLTLVCKALHASHTSSLPDYLDILSSGQLLFLISTLELCVADHFLVTLHICYLCSFIQ